MTILNRSSNGHVPALVALWRTARAFGDRDRVQLLTRCIPPPTPDKLHEAPMAKTLATFRGLGMFEGDDDALALAPPFNTIVQHDVESLRTAALDLLLRDGNAPAFLTADLTEQDDDNSRASDFVRVACWTLAQDPYWLSATDSRPGGGPAIEREASEQGVPLSQGSGRWASFQEWAYFTGLAVPTVHGFVPCPARAVRVKLPAMGGLTTDLDLPLRDFLDQLAEALPVLDGGRYRREIDACRASASRRVNAAVANLQVSPALSLALLQLEHEGEIVLSDRPGDVAQRIAILGRGGTVIASASHIRRGRSRFPHIDSGGVQP